MRNKNHSFNNDQDAHDNDVVETFQSIAQCRKLSERDHQHQTIRTHNLSNAASGKSSVGNMSLIRASPRKLFWSGRVPAWLLIQNGMKYKGQVPNKMFMSSIERASPEECKVQCLKRVFCIACAMGYFYSRACTH